MANASVKNNKLFQKTFDLLKSDTAKKAGLKRVERTLNNRIKNTDKIMDIYDQYLNNANKPKIKKKALKELKKYGLSGKLDDIGADEVEDFVSRVENLRPDMDAFKANPMEYIKDDPYSATQFAKGAIKDYYTNGTKAQKRTRIGLTAGAYVGGALGIRALSGGTLTVNSDGEEDIAGIPFI